MPIPVDKIIATVKPWRANSVLFVVFGPVLPLIRDHGHGLASVFFDLLGLISVAYGGILVIVFFCDLILIQLFNVLPKKAFLTKNKIIRNFEALSIVAIISMYWFLASAFIQPAGL